jgi:hypothetical protein
LLFFGWFIVPIAIGLLTRNWTVAGLVVVVWPVFWALVAVLLRLTSAPTGPPPSR